MAALLGGATDDLRIARTASLPSATRTRAHIDGDVAVTQLTPRRPSLSKLTQSRLQPLFPSGPFDQISEVSSPAKVRLRSKSSSGNHDKVRLRSKSSSGNHDITSHATQPYVQHDMRSPNSTGSQIAGADELKHEPLGILDLVLRRGKTRSVHSLEHAPLPLADLLFRRGRKSGNVTPNVIDKEECKTLDDHTPGIPLLVGAAEGSDSSWQFASDKKDHTPGKPAPRAESVPTHVQTRHLQESHHHLHAAASPQIDVAEHSGDIRPRFRLPPLRDDHTLLPSSSSCRVRSAHSRHRTHTSSQKKCNSTIMECHAPTRRAKAPATLHGALCRGDDEALFKALCIGDKEDEDLAPTEFVTAETQEHKVLLKGLRKLCSEGAQCDGVERRIHSWAHASREHRAIYLD